jgi:DNA-binding GntR family transcriptional regulator
VLFQRVVDDILTKIETGELYPNAQLPSARTMAEQYGGGVMTIQRALRELQQMKVTYSVAGRGTFIYPTNYLALKYEASGWWTTMASVDCSGSSWNSSDSTTPIRSGSRIAAIWARSSRSGQAA